MLAARGMQLNPDRERMPHFTAPFLSTVHIRIFNDQRCDLTIDCGVCLGEQVELLER